MSTEKTNAQRILKSMYFYNIVYSCGHEQTSVNLSNRNESHTLFSKKKQRRMCYTVDNFMYGSK